MGFATALASRDEAALASARDRLNEVAGPEVLVDAAGIAGNFQRMVRIADSIGIPVIVSGGVATNDDVIAAARHHGRGICGVIVGRAIYTGGVDLATALTVARKEVEET